MSGVGLLPSLKIVKNDAFLTVVLDRMIVEIPNKLCFNELFQFLVENPDNKLISSSDYTIKFANMDSPSLVGPTLNCVFQPSCVVFLALTH